MKGTLAIERNRCVLDPYDENIGEIQDFVPYSELKEEDVTKLQLELRETTLKLRAITQKFGAVRKERDGLKKENRELQTEVMSIQNSMREMIPGFSNTGSVYPMYNELQLQASDFMKCSCEDIFFDVLSPELTMDGVIFFFKESFEGLSKPIQSYFGPTYESLRKSTCSSRLEGPMLNVLRKVYQNNWKKIHSTCLPDNICEGLMKGLQSKLSLGDCQPSTNSAIVDFLRNLGKLLFLCYISDPEFIFGTDSIGSVVQFNSLRHESVDGFVRPKEPCVVVLPPLYKHALGAECILKAHVLPTKYEFSQ